MDLVKRLKNRMLLRARDSLASGTPITRRASLMTAIVIGAASALGVNTRWRPKTRQAGSVTHLSVLFSDLEGSRRLGCHYLSTHPDEADVRMLAAWLYGEAGRSWPDGTAALRRKIAEQRDADFIAGRITHLHGWVLARTEARACALVALT